MANWKQDPERIKDVRKMQDMIKQAPMIIYFTQQVNPSEPEPVVTPMVEKIEAMMVTSIMMGIEPRIRLASHHPLQKGRNLTGGVWMEDDRMRAVLVMGPPGKEEMVTLERTFDATRYAEVLSMMAFKGQQFQSQYQHAVGEVMASIFDPNTHHYQSADKTKGMHVEVVKDTPLITTATLSKYVPTLEERDAAFDKLSIDQQNLLFALSKRSDLPVKLFMRWVLVYRAGVSDDEMIKQIYSNIVSHRTNQTPRPTPVDLLSIQYGADAVALQLIQILPRYLDNVGAPPEPATFPATAEESESAIAQFGVTRDIIDSGVDEKWAARWLLEIVHLSYEKDPGPLANDLQELMAVDIHRNHKFIDAQGNLIAYVLFGVMSRAVMEASDELRNKWWERRKKIRQEYGLDGKLKE